MIVWKIDVISALKTAGYNSLRVQKEGIMNSGTYSRIKNGGACSFETLSRICAILKVQPGVLIGYVPDEEGEKE